MRFGGRSFKAFIIGTLIMAVSFLNEKGLDYNMAFIFVFGTFEFAAIYFIKRKAEETHGKSRAISIFAFGFGGIVILVMTLILLGY